MITEITDGGAAFPSVSATGYVENGMTLRDYFAGQVLASGKWSYSLDGSGATAAACYQIADAMLAERNSESA